MDESLVRQTCYDRMKLGNILTNTGDHRKEDEARKSQKLHVLRGVQVKIQGREASPGPEGRNMWRNP